PTPPPRRARPQTENPDAFDASRLSQLINRSDPSGGGQGTSDASLGTAGGRTAAALTLSEKDALRAQMQRCWNPPIGLANAEDMIVVVQIRLGPDGSVVNIDRVGGSVGGALYDTASDSARRAVLQCQPYRLPVEKYDAWKDIQVTFDPRDLF
ncbi:MAG: cell envelope integrity protein TolA, partial [Pseudomonadota bacterium]